MASFILCPEKILEQVDKLYASLGVVDGELRELAKSIPAEKKEQLAEVLAAAKLLSAKFGKLVDEVYLIEGPVGKFSRLP